MPEGRRRTLFESRRQMFYRHVGKRLFDLVIASVGLVLTAPLMMVLALQVARNLGRPVLFRQPRLGFRGEVFDFIKFRTMTDERAADGTLLSDAERLTPFGRFLRSTSLDELPQLFCVLRGDMSLIGPRPLLVQYRERYSPEQFRRHEVRPGITGLAQVNGRNQTTWQQRFALDVEYVDNVSLLMDLEILWRTLSVVLSRKGTDQSGGVTFPEFMGNTTDETV